MTVRFQTRVSNGTIPIPIEFAPALTGMVEVEAKTLTEARFNRDEPYDIIAELTRNPIKIEDYEPPSRDEIYDRKL